MTIREDVHIHAEAPIVYRRLMDLGSLSEWLPERFRHVRAEGERCSFTLALPLRAESAQLHVAIAEEPYTLTLATDNSARNMPPASSTDSNIPAIQLLRWELQPEGRGEVHVTVAAVYRPPRGIAGPLLDLLMFRPCRRQALRDALWKLKHLIEASPSM